jgi:hypothetical protein
VRGSNGGDQRIDTSPIGAVVRIDRPCRTVAID